MVFLLYRISKHNVIFSSNSFKTTFVRVRVRYGNELNIDGYTNKNARKDRKNKKGGGLIAYFANHVKYERLSCLENDQVESMWFKICPANEQPFLLCFVYRPPNSSVVWYDKFENEVSNHFVFQMH